MARVRLWISKHRMVGNVFLIDHDDGHEECFPLKTPPAEGVRVGTQYEGEFRGYDGIYHDLPRGFPTNNQEAAQRLSDPSIPSVMQQLIRENFSIRSIPPELANSR